VSDCGLPLRQAGQQIGQLHTVCNVGLCIPGAQHRDLGSLRHGNLTAAGMASAGLVEGHLSGVIGDEDDLTDPCLDAVDSHVRGCLYDAVVESAQGKVGPQLLQQLHPLLCLQWGHAVRDQDRVVRILCGQWVGRYVHGVPLKRYGHLRRLSGWTGSDSRPPGRER
jgi:hypothetical protein